jgi:hypothetical protein
VRGVHAVIGSIDMNGRHLNGTIGSGKPKRAAAAKRPKSRSSARKAAWRRIVAASGVTPTQEGMEAILQELRRA